MADEDQYLRDLQREYLDFLDDEEDQGVYSEQVKKMINEKSRRLLVNINDLRKKNVARASALLVNAFEEQLAFSMALKEYVSTIQPTFSKGNIDFYVAFEGSFGNKHVTPRNLTSNALGSLVCLEGIVTKVSLIRPKVIRSVHFCPATKKILERKYTDMTSHEGIPNSTIYPTKDEDGNLLETEFGLCTYKDHQTLSIQEMPEKAPAGQLPRSVDVICDDDLVDKCKPGDRVQIVGTYRCLPGKQGGYTSGIFRTVLIANNVSTLQKDSSLVVTREEINICKKLAKKHNIFELLSKSLAPSIHGHEYVKRAILCLLLGGMEKNLSNGTRLRGDINVLLIGDPSVAKSQLLRYVLHTAPRAIPTTGRGSSGVGLTAAVTSDQETGERRLEAGAMVLADRGVVCIDEFDKMTDIDRTAIHEVMEQGRVTISKAGIHASLNARCSVLAAANPVYGQYDQYKTPMENIGLQDSLLSRFDLLFVMLDKVDEDLDEIIADHVVNCHRYRHPKEQEGDVLPMGSTADMLSTFNSDDNDTISTIYERYDPLLHRTSRKKTDQILSVDFMKKYINIAKCMKPKLTLQACELISSEYSRLRSQEMLESDIARTQPVTARTLETLIRLATSHAKARLSKTVIVVDAEAAIELVQFAYFKKVLDKQITKRKREGSADEFNEQDETSITEERVKRPKRRRQSEHDSEDDEIFSSQQPDDNDLTTRESIQTLRRSTLNDTPPANMISDEKFNIFKGNLQMLFKESRKQTLSINEVISYINKEGGNTFATHEVESALQRMTVDNQIMVADDFVILI